MSNTQITDEVRKIVLKHHREVDGEKNCNGEYCENFSRLFVMGLDCAINAVELVTGIKGKVEVTK